MLERGALNFVFDLAIPQSTFNSDELPLLESLGELREIPPSIDAMLFGAGFVLAFVVLPALLGCDVAMAGEWYHREPAGLATN
jgi:hypothetical protein